MQRWMNWSGWAAALSCDVKNEYLEYIEELAGDNNDCFGR